MDNWKSPGGGQDDIVTSHGLYTQQLYFLTRIMAIDRKYHYASSTPRSSQTINQTLILARSLTSKSPHRTKSNTIQLPWTTNLYQTPILNRYVGYHLFTGPRSSSTTSSEKEATAPGLSVVSKHFLRISMTTCHISSIISPETISHNSDSRAHNPTKPPSQPSANHPTSAPSFQKQCAAISPQERHLRWARCSSSGCVRLLTI